MTRVIEVRLPAAEGNVWAEDAAEILHGVPTMFEVAGVRVMVRVIQAEVDPLDNGYLLMRLQMPKPKD